MRPLILGAGKTGRGFIGRLFQQQGSGVVFADGDEQLIAALQNAGEYQVRFFTEREPVRCDSFEAVTAWPEAVLPWWSEIDALFVSVGVDNLQRVGEFLGGLRRSAPDTRVLPVFLCENAVDPISMLVRDAAELAVIRQRFDLRRGAVFCTNTTDQPGPLDLVSEDYNTIECELPTGEFDLAKYSFLEPVEDFDLLIRRKLYTYNAVTAILGFIGWWKGYEYLHEAAGDTEIAGLCHRFYRAVNQAIAQRLGVALSEQEAFAVRSWNKFTNEAIADPISRNIRNPISKLKPDERIIAPLRLIGGEGLDTEPMEITAAVGALYAVEPEGNWDAGTLKKAIDSLKSDCGLQSTEPFTTRIGEVMNWIVKAVDRSALSSLGRE